MTLVVVDRMRRTNLPEWAKTAYHQDIPPDALNRIQHIRRLMLVHSCIYYRLNDNVVSDHQWMEWAQELLHFQTVFGSDVGFYDRQFADWDGSSGFHLVYDDNVVNAALKLIKLRDQSHGHIIGSRRRLKNV